MTNYEKMICDKEAVAQFLKEHWDCPECAEKGMNECDRGGKCHFVTIEGCREWLDKEAEDDQQRSN